MQNDTISRSALVAELEAFKMSLGDVVLRLIVDRVTEIVKAQPGVAAEEVRAPNPPSEGRVFEHRELYWYHDNHSTEPILTQIEKYIREGWSPNKWLHGIQLDTGHRRICFRFVREIR